MTARPRLFSAIITVVVATIATGGAIWACVPQPQISLQPRSSGPPGSQLTVDGANFENTVELRWNMPDGPLLASVPSPSFSVPISLPDAPDGLYVIVALERAPSGGVGNLARATVQIARLVTTSRQAAAAESRRSSASDAFAVALGVTAGIALVLVGVLAGARIARRTGKGAPPV